MNGLKNITFKDKYFIDEFIKNLGKSGKTFRYFNTRDSTIVKQHIVTFLFFINNTPIAYGHLDQEEDIVWLGIAIAEKYTGKGFGKLIMQHLTEYADNNNINTIRLSVDKENLSAIKLYYKFNFTLALEKNNTLYLERRIK